MASHGTCRTGSGLRGRSRLVVAAALRSRGLLRAACRRLRMTEAHVCDGRIGKEAAACADRGEKRGLERFDRRKGEAGRCRDIHCPHIKVTGRAETETVSEY